MARCGDQPKSSKLLLLDIIGVLQLGREQYAAVHERLPVPVHRFAVTLSSWLCPASAAVATAFAAALAALGAPAQLRACLERELCRRRRRVRDDDNRVRGRGH